MKNSLYIPLWHGGGAALPFAAPELLEGPARRGSAPDMSSLVDYLLAKRGDAPFIVATARANTAASIILATGEPVMAMGGFSGGDQILPVEDLEEWVAFGAVRLFLVPNQDEQQWDLLGWIKTHCAPVPSEHWLPAMPGPGQPPNPGLVGASQLFDCGTE